MPIPGGSAKKTAVLIFWCLLHGVFFEKMPFALRKISGHCSHFFRKLFILFAKILILKLRVYLKDTPPKLKAS
jgi:hypothetical protein